MNDDTLPNEPELPTEPPPAEASRPHIQVDVRSLSLVVLALVAGVAALHWAKEVLVPLLLGGLLSYALAPLVRRLERWHVQRALAAALLLLATVGAVGYTAYRLTDDAAALIESLPDTAQKLRRALQPHRGQAEGPIEQVQKAATELQEAAEQAVKSPPPRGVTRVQVEKPKLDVREYLWSGTLGVVTLAGQAVMVVFIAFFTLASGDTFRRKLMRIAGPAFSRQKITLQMLDRIGAQIQRYLLVNVATSFIVGVSTWLVFLWIGLEHAAVWGVIAGVLNMVPYLGAIATTTGAALFAFVQFGALDKGLLVASASFVIQSLEGYLLTPWLTSRASRMSPLVVFVGVLVFGWLWGMWGLLLGVPILMVVKAVCDHVDTLKPIGELLGD
jgi:predicted PurR-regulated permease PerM